MRPVSSPQYEDDEGDKVLISTDSDLADAVSHARVAGWKVQSRRRSRFLSMVTRVLQLTPGVRVSLCMGFQVLRLHIYYSNTLKQMTAPSDLAPAEKSDWTSLHAGVLAGAALLTGIGLLVLLRRPRS